MITMEQDKSYNKFEGFMDWAYSLQKTCKNKLQQCYGDEKITLPVDIKKVVRGLKIKLESTDLNFGADDGIDLNIAWLRYEEDGTATIYVNTEEDADTEKPYSDLQKYAIAYELGKLIIEKKNEQTGSKMQPEEIKRWNMVSVPYSLPRLYAQCDSFAYEMCAIFLLLPLDLFLDEFLSYIGDAREHPVIMDKWIKHLSDKAGIPNYQLINGYQYIKFCAYKYYQEKYIIGPDDKIEGTDYRELYR